MKLAGVTVLDRHVEKLAFLLIDSGDLPLSLRLTEALENETLELDLDEQDSLAVLSVSVIRPRASQGCGASCCGSEHGVVEAAPGSGAMRVRGGQIARRRRPR